MRVLVTGGQGQVASAVAGAADGIEFHRVGRPDFDFDRPGTLAAVLDAVAPAMVVNAAAFTAVDAAESEPNAAWRANAEGPARLAALAAERRLPLIHLSTDYVFDGRKGAPYVETDPVAPLGVYGASKLAGEQAVLAAGGPAMVLRTSWVYAARGRNFVRTMLETARTRPLLRVVADQKGCPTAAPDLGAAIRAVIAAIRRAGWQDRFAGIFHVAGTGWTTWHGFAVAVFEVAASHAMPSPGIAPIATSEWVTAARRPPDSRLDSARFAATFGHRLPPWRESLGAIVPDIMRELTAPPPGPSRSEGAPRASARAAVPPR
jgi:dTDP-4-dehydrorhamnose reductase